MVGDRRCREPGRQREDPLGRRRLRVAGARRGRLLALLGRRSPSVVVRVRVAVRLVRSGNRERWWLNKGTFFLAFSPVVVRELDPLGVGLPSHELGRHVALFRGALVRGELGQRLSGPGAVKARHGLKQQCNKLRNGPYSNIFFGLPFFCASAWLYQHYY